ncbi:MAG: tetratricopeptide repeat protein [Alphaproteobacteria bacterium]|nr:tetratricopeptide repeat protein [Alphaproteobacteria bacterium]
MVRLPLWAMLIVVAAGASVAHADSVTTTRAWSNCQGGEGIWAEMRISGCNDVIKSGKAAGADLAKAYYNRANTLMQKSEYKKAIDDYTQALQLTPEDANSLHERCWARAVLNIDLEDALSDCNESLRLQPNDAETLGGRAFVYLRLGFFRTAVIDYDAALKLKPQDALLMFARGTAKTRAGDDDGGKADRGAARAIDPEVETTFVRYEAGAASGGMWASMVEYWRAAMRWIY